MTQLPMNVRKLELDIYAKRLRFINREMAVLTASLAFAAASTDAPIQFAYASFFVVILFGYHHDRPYQGILELWRKVNHPLVQVRRVWRDYLPIIVAWSLLSLVAVGFVDKHGFILR